jgi:hypothetical protein
MIIRNVEMIRKVPGAKIACYDPAGQVDYVLNHRFAHRDAPELFRTLARIEAAGQIDTNHWHVARRGEI